MSESDSDAEVGPMPAGAPGAAHDDDGAAAFRAREERMRAAHASAEAASRPSARPAWMVEMPEDAGSPAWRPGAGPLRPRGFHQGGRVQRQGGAGGETSAHARRLWSETPEQRAQRILRGGDAGDDAADDAHEDEARERLARERAAKRDAEIRAQIESMDPTRRAPLLEQHRQKQIDEVKRRRAERGGGGGVYEAEERSDRERSDRERSDRERSDRERSGRERSDRDRDRERAERHERHERHRRERHERHRHDHERHARHERHRHDHERHARHERHRSDREGPRSDGERSRARERRRSASPPRRKTRAEREAEDLAHPPTPLFDKDKVLGAGARTMDERARARTVADAAELGARFANGARGAFL